MTDFSPPGPQEDGFRMPGGRWCLLQRSIVYNSWLSWGQAIAPTARRRPLSRDQVMHIAKLARILSAAQRSVTRLRPQSSPFRVQRWWDPDDPQWSHGRRCLLSIEGLGVSEWLVHLPSTHVIHSARGPQAAEVLLLRSPLAPLPAPRSRRLKGVTR